MSSKITPELIRYARRHAYEWAEGFCNEGPKTEIENAVASAIDDLSPEAFEYITQRAEELSVASGTRVEVAESALINWLLKQHLDRLGIGYA